METLYYNPASNPASSNCEDIDSVAFYCAYIGIRVNITLHSKKLYEGYNRLSGLSEYIYECSENIHILNETYKKLGIEFFPFDLCEKVANYITKPYTDNGLSAHSNRLIDPSILVLSSFTS
jgi:hypothetical protein